MTAELRQTTTQLLTHLQQGDRRAAEELLPRVYAEFHALAERYLSRERPDHTLQPTSLVHEAFLRLVDQSQVNWQGRTHFLAMGANFMRRILVDHARARLRAKRGGGLARIQLPEHLTVTPSSAVDVLAVDEALTKLAQLDARQASIVEMRFFAGMTVAEVAQALGVSTRTVESEWTLIRAWLRRELAEETTP